jgi:tight adherence protein B
MSPNTIMIFVTALIIVVSGVIALVSLVNALLIRDDMGDRLETYAVIPAGDVRQQNSRVNSFIIRMRIRINSTLSIFSSEELNLKLISANWPITETEYILIRIVATILGLGIGWLLFRSSISGFGFALIAFLVPGLYLNRSIHVRRSNFEKQLIDVLVLIKGSVQAGFSFLQATDIVVREMKPPASEEFARVRREVGLGVPLSQALANLNLRMKNDDLFLVSTAVNINTQVGGNMATMLEAVSETIRDRIRLFGEVRALTSQQRFSGYLLTLLPFIVVAVLFVISPDYVSRLFQPGVILCVPVGALVMVILGNILIRLMSRIDV